MRLSRFAPAALALLTACGSGQTRTDVPKHAGKEVASTIEGLSYSAAITTREAILSKINLEIDKIKDRVREIIETTGYVGINWDQLIRMESLSKGVVQRMQNNYEQDPATADLASIAKVLGVILIDPSYLERTQARIRVLRNAGRMAESVRLENELTRKLTEEGPGLETILAELMEVRRGLDRVISGAGSEAELRNDHYIPPPRAKKSSPLDQ